MIMSTINKSQHIQNADIQNTVIPTSNSARDNKKNSRFHGLLPMIYFSLGFIGVLVLLKLIMNLLTNN